MNIFDLLKVLESPRTSQHRLHRNRLPLIGSSVRDSAHNLVVMHISLRRHRDRHQQPRRAATSNGLQKHSRSHGAEPQPRRANRVDEAFRCLDRSESPRVVGVQASVATPLVERARTGYRLLGTVEELHRGSPSATTGHRRTQRHRLHPPERPPTGASAVDRDVLLNPHRRTDTLELTPNANSLSPLTCNSVIKSTSRAHPAPFRVTELDRPELRIDQTRRSLKVTPPNCPLILSIIWATNLGPSLLTDQLVVPAGCSANRQHWPNQSRRPSDAGSAG